MSFYRRSLFSPRRFSSAESKAGMPGVCFTSVARSFSCFTSDNALMTWNSWKLRSFFFGGVCFGGNASSFSLAERKDQVASSAFCLVFFRAFLGQVSRFRHRFDTVHLGPSFGLFRSGLSGIIFWKNSWIEMPNSSALTHLDIEKKQLEVENFGNMWPPVTAIFLVCTTLKPNI